MIYLLFILNFLLLVICVLISVAFLTLLERKVLGYMQIHKGPNKVGFVGIPQPFSDAINIICKQQPIPITSNYLLHYFSPVFNLNDFFSCLSNISLFDLYEFIFMLFCVVEIVCLYCNNCCLII